MTRPMLFWILFAVAHFIVASAIPLDTVPAFLWSHNPSRSLSVDRQDDMDYNTIPSKDLAKNVLNVGGWADFLCDGAKPDHSMDVALVFIGNRLRSTDLSRTRNVDAKLINLLKESLKESGSSFSFPYVSLSNEGHTLAQSLVSGFRKSCSRGFGNNTIFVTKQCIMDGSDEISELKSLTEELRARKESKTSDATDLIFMCNYLPSFQLSREVDEGKLLADTLETLKESGISYSFLYVSEPFDTVPLLRLKKSERQLLANTTEDASEKTYCDRVCQTKASLLEGFLVSLVLLIILLSGLCCMSGIQSPKRFETPRE